LVCEKAVELSILIGFFDLNEYEVVEQIGEKGQVWLWRRRGGRGEISVKCFAFGADCVKNEEIRRNFIREVECLVTLSHPCIVSLKGHINESLKEIPDFIHVRMNSNKKNGLLIFRPAIFSSIPRRRVQFHAASVSSNPKIPSRISWKTFSPSPAS
jgi:hypothetical protein